MATFSLNGKQVDAQGQPVAYGTSPVLWGEPGTNGQHAYFQMLHQGTDVVPVEFIAVKRPAAGHETGALADLHAKLLANCLAQSQALMQGKSAEEAAAESPPTASKTIARDVIARELAQVLRASRQIDAELATGRFDDRVLGPQLFRQLEHTLLTHSVPPLGRLARRHQPQHQR